MNFKKSSRKQTTGNDDATSEDYVKGFQIIKECLSKCNRDTTNLKYEVTPDYCEIMDSVETKWLVRLYFGTHQKSVFVRIPDDQCKALLPHHTISGIKDSSRVNIKNIDALHELWEAIALAFDYVNEQEAE